jgi:hypothetical protein
MSKSLDDMTQEEINDLIGADQPDSDGWTWEQGHE